MKLIIAGSRSLTGLPLEVVANLVKLLPQFPTTVVSGLAGGIDSIGIKWSRVNNIPVECFPANWQQYGKSAGYVRNLEMAQHADMLLAIWDSKSRGTLHMITTMITLNKPTYVATFNGQEWQIRQHA